MDLTDAMRLAESGRGQAEAELVGSQPAPYGSERPPRRQPRRTADSEPRALSPFEWSAWIDDVARAMHSRTDVRRHWYDLRTAEKERWRRLAELAVCAVDEARIDRTLRRIRERTIRPRPLSNERVNEIERANGVDLRADSRRENRRAA